jgi:cholesterol transport system auxiliary component
MGGPGPGAGAGPPDPDLRECWPGRLGLRPGQRISPDVQLNTNIRSFNIDAATGTAVVEITARIVGDRTGQIQRARLFAARVPAGAVDGPGAAQALDRALSQVLVEIVRWAR